MNRLYDIDPAKVKVVVDVLKEAATSTVWIMKFLEDSKIKRMIEINDGFYNNVRSGKKSSELINEEDHHQFHEGLAEAIIAGCIQKSSFEAKHEFCTGEGKNKKDTVDFKVVGKEHTYLIEIRSTRESERSKKINKIYELNGYSEEAIEETINADNICVDNEPYENTRRLQRQILEKCTRRAEKDEEVIPHKFPTKDKINAKHIVVCLLFGHEFCDDGELVDVLYRDYSCSMENQVNARGIFHKDRTDEASKILQERIDCVVFVNPLWDKFEIYIGYNPKYFKEENSMKEFEAMLATFFDADKIRRIHPDPIYGLVGAEVIGIKPTDQPLILQNWSLDSNNITINLEKKIAILSFQKLKTNQNDLVAEIQIPFSLGVFKDIDLVLKNDHQIKHHILGCLSLDSRLHQPLNGFTNTIYADQDKWDKMFKDNSRHIIFDRNKILILISSAVKLYSAIQTCDLGGSMILVPTGDFNNPNEISIQY